MTILERLTPLLEVAEELALEDPRAAEAALEAALPFASKPVQELRAALIDAANANTICNKGDGAVRFSRLAKPEAARGFSIDIVKMSGVGPKHRHPKGEIDLCFTWDGDPKFDGHVPGWVVYAGDSRHSPTVTGGTMIIVYLLPGGEIEWLKS